jgi:hypothetical protein
MTTAPCPRVGRPTRAPTKAELAERDAFAALSANSLAGVRTSAQTWRTGLTAFITLVTTGVVIKGREATRDLTTSWCISTTVLVVGGLALAILGLWQALAAEAGTAPKKQNLTDIRATYGTLATYQVVEASHAARRLAWARRAVAAAATLLLVGIATTWWAPSAPRTPLAFLQVVRGTQTLCGTLQSADSGELRLGMDGSREPAGIPLSEITNLKLVNACP